MSAHRFLFYAPDAGRGDATVSLTGDEHHHLARVLRVAPGEEVFVTNGDGMIATCRVESVGEACTALAVTATETEAGGVDLTLALALVRKDRFAQALEQCVELGVTRVLPFTADRSQVHRYGEGTMSRLRRIAVSAMKQSFRARLPEVADPVGFEAVVAAATAADCVVVGDREAPHARKPVGGTSVLAVVGPEAGLTTVEIGALVGAGARLASVSRHRLRSETAAAVLVAALAQRD